MYLLHLVLPALGMLSVVASPVYEHTVKRGSAAKVQAAYFTNWGIYGADFQPTDINSAPLTHILYAFADIQSDGTIVLTDPYADEQKRFPGDSWSEPGNNLYGCLKQLYLIKLRQRNIKTLLSVGGWTYSQDNHFAFVTDAAARASFVDSAVQLVNDYGFDGIDLDFEYPADGTQGQGFADLLTALRSAFDALAEQNGDAQPYQLTAAVTANYSSYIELNVPQMDAALSYWNLMAYDYAGSWLAWADNQANLYGGERTNVSTDMAIRWYLANGASAGKLNMGIPLYGRSFEQTDGIGDPYNGVGPATYPYADLPQSGTSVFQDFEDVASYSYDESNEELVSYDTPQITTIKAQYVMDNGLAGHMFWDLSQDKTNSPDSLVSTTAGVFGGLDQTPNHITYPESKWDNIRSNMADSSQPSSSAATPPSADSGVVTANSAHDAAPASSGCGPVPAWDSGAAYEGGDQVFYSGHVWTAKWWTQGDPPGGSADVWVDNSPCSINSKSHHSSFIHFVSPGHS